MAEWVQLHFLSTTTPLWNTRMETCFHGIYKEKLRIISLTCHLLTVLKLFSCSHDFSHILGRKMPHWRLFLLSEMWLASLLEENRRAPGGKDHTPSATVRDFIPVSSFTAPTSKMSSNLAVISETVIRKHVKNPEKVWFFTKNTVSVHCLQHSEVKGYCVFFGEWWEVNVGYVDFYV